MVYLRTRNGSSFCGTAAAQWRYKLGFVPPTKMCQLPGSRPPKSSRQSGMHPCQTPFWPLLCCAENLTLRVFLKDRHWNSTSTGPATTPPCTKPLCKSLVWWVRMGKASSLKQFNAWSWLVADTCSAMPTASWWNWFPLPRALRTSIAIPSR